MEFWMRLEKEHPVACGMFYGTIIIMIVSLMIISLVALTLQKLILQRYADEYFFLNTRFFVDDGFSEVSFEREGLQAMLRKVEAENVATVIAKDLSRLGRNYLKTGELIEIVFPEYEVRYIAINDGVETAREDNEFIPLWNWVSATLS